VLALDLGRVSRMFMQKGVPIRELKRTLAFLEIGIVVRDRCLVLYCGGWIVS
jgi:hypothetical protein